MKTSGPKNPTQEILNNKKVMHMYSNSALKNARAKWGKNLDFNVNDRKFTLKAINPKYRIVDDDIDDFVSELSKKLRVYRLKNAHQLIIKCKRCYMKKPYTVRLLTTVLFTNFNQLRQISISFKYCLQILAQVMLGINPNMARYLKNLEHLALEFPGFEHLVTDAAIKQINSKILYRLKNLRSLKLNYSRCAGVSDESIIHLARIISRRLLKLNHLSLDFTECRNLNISGFLKLHSILFNQISNLESMTFKFSQEIQPEFFNELWKKADFRLCKLKKLKLKFSERVLDDNGQNKFDDLFSSMSRYFKNLQDLELNLSNSSNPVPHTAQEMKELATLMCAYLPNLKKLSLNFKGWTEATDQSAEALVTALSQLQSLTSLTINFTMCEKITGKGLTLLWAQLNSFKSIDSISLNFSGCTNISDSQLIQLTKNLNKTMRSLKSFELFFTAPVKSSALALGTLGIFGETRPTMKGIQNFIVSMGRQLLELKRFALHFNGFAYKEFDDKELIKVVAHVNQGHWKLQDLCLDFSGCGSFDKVRETAYAALTPIEKVAFIL